MPGDSGADARERVLAFQRPLMWRTLAWTFAAGALLALASALLFPDDRREIVAGLAIAGFCAVLSAVLWLVPGRLPTWIAHAMVALGTVAISVGASSNARVNNDDELLYLWVAIFAFYFFSRRAALAHMALVALGYHLALFTREGAVPDDRLRWLMTITTLTVGGLVVHHLASRQHVMIRRLTEAVRSDPLTGLLNRKGFRETFESQLAAAQRRGAPLGLIVGDLDGFKQVNDRLGHAAGDQTLQAVSAVLHESTRGGDRPARLGGEEFALIAADADREQALRAAERVRMRVRERFADSEVPVTISFGVAVFPHDGASADELLLAADRALYRAKEAGRDRTMVDGESLTAGGD